MSYSSPKTFASIRQVLGGRNRCTLRLVYSAPLPPCVATPIGGSMPESGYRAGLPVKLRRLADRLFRSYLYEAPRTYFGATASGGREHGTAGLPTRRVQRG